MTVAGKRRTKAIYWLAALLLVGFVVFGIGVFGGATSDFRAAVGAQPPMKTVVLDGVRIAYTDTGGRGPVIICLHAIGHGARDFEALSHRFERDYRVIAIDFPGQGNSGSDPEPASGTRYTEILTAFMRALHLDSVVLLGNSIGGATAVRFAILHPDEVRALVLCDSGGLMPPPGFGMRLAIDAFVQFFAAGERGAPWFPWVFARYYDGVLKGAPAAAQRERIVRSAYEIAPVLTQAWESFARPEESLWSALPKIRCPVLLAWAKDDFVVPLAANRASFSRIPNHTLEVFTAGHAAFLEDPDHFAAVLHRFLRQMVG
jgi:4,5:9,10-diseco-3-hydroxy-5,9,17-trioxoandrosta-1(10),2-diene-4-oate hydrolase